MAIRWQWNEKAGEAVIKQTINGEIKEFTATLYNGNCHLIFLNEFKEDGVEKYNMYMFFADKDHMDKCLGIKKNADGTYYNILDTPYSKLTKLRINKKKCRYMRDIINSFTKAFDELTIEIYNEE